MRHRCIPRNRLYILQIKCPMTGAGTKLELAFAADLGVQYLDTVAQYCCLQSLHLRTELYKKAIIMFLRSL